MKILVKNEQKQLGEEQNTNTSIRTCIIPLLFLMNTYLNENFFSQEGRGRGIDISKIVTIF